MRLICVGASRLDGGEKARLDLHSGQNGGQRVYAIRSLLGGKRVTVKLTDAP